MSGLDCSLGEESEILCSIIHHLDIMSDDTSYLGIICQGFPLVEGWMEAGKPS